MISHPAFLLITTSLLGTAQAATTSAADIVLTSPDFHATITVHQDPVIAPCADVPASFRNVVEPFGCVRLVRVNTSESLACPGWAPGSRWYSRPVTYLQYLQWTGRGNSGTLVGEGEKTIGAWDTSTCDPDGTRPPVTPPATGPKVGEGFVIPPSVSAMICGPSDAGYNTGGSSLIHDTYRNQLIAHYRAFGMAGRCPETEGYNYWMRRWWDFATAAAQDPFHAPGGNPQNLPWGNYVNQFMDEVWTEIKDAVNFSASTTGESGPAGVTAANGLCQQAANAKYGFERTTATYILKSGNQCRVTTVP